MAAAVPGEFVVGDQPGVGLMNQSGRLQRVSGPLFAHALLRDLPQLIVYERQKLFRIGRTGIVGGLQEACDFVLRRFVGHGGRALGSSRAERMPRGHPTT